MRREGKATSLSFEDTGIVKEEYSKPKKMMGEEGWKRVIGR